MPVEFKDYYAVLGVPRDASEADLKRAFRNLAREFHPDVAKDKARAEARFKEINEANEVLSDPVKRQKYDELGAHWNHPERAPRPAPEGFGSEPDAGSEFRFEGTGFSDFFEQFFGSRGRAAGGGFGQARAPGPGEDDMARRGQDIEGDLLVSLGEILHGALRSITLQRGDPRAGPPRAQTLQVKIPPGVREGQLIRLAGQGQAGLSGGAAGHLYLRVRIAQHPAFRVRGADLYHDLDLAPWEAVLGCTLDLAMLEGVAALRIPAGTVAERTFRLRGLGLPRGDGTRGDLLAVVVIQVPPSVTAEQRAHWEKLASAATFRPRSPT